MAAAFADNNIIRLREVFMPSSELDLYIVTELMDTDLHRVIYSRQDLSLDHVRWFVYQTLRGLKFLHSAGVVHRDIKPLNLLVNSDCDLRICDFGLSREIDAPDSSSRSAPGAELTEYVVTRWYRSPELMLASTSNEFLGRIDTWSVGCILYELLARRPCFAGNDYIHQLELIMAQVGKPSEDDLAGFVSSAKARRFVQNSKVQRNDDPWAAVRRRTVDGCEMLERLLSFTPRRRPSAAEAMEEPFLETLRDPDDEPVATARYKPRDLEMLSISELGKSLCGDAGGQ